MAEYIEREALTIEKLEKYMTIMEVNTKEYGQQVVVAVDDLIYLPTADVVEVVRCKDCKWWHKETECLNPNGGYGFLPNGEWFCASGQRKEGG